MIALTASVDTALHETSDGGETPARDRILKAAFDVFTDKGYEGASTLTIATKAKVSKRALYELFGNKHDVLVACIEARAARMRLAAQLPTPTTMAMLEAVLETFAARVLTEVSDPTVVAVHRLAIAEATRSPEIAQTLERIGRQSAAQTLVQCLRQAQDAGLLAAGDPAQFATEFMALAWEGQWINLMLGVTPGLTKKQIAAQVQRAVRSLVVLHGTPPRPTAGAPDEG